MDILFKERLSTANFFLQENELEKSIENYEDALELASSNEQKINLHNVLGRLYQKMKRPEKAIASFEESISLYENSSENDSSVDKASILNNLGAIYLESNLILSIKNYKAARKIFATIIESDNKAYYPHLANTNFALAEVYNKKSDFYSAKKYFKEAIVLYDQLSDKSFDELRASAYYHLGNIYTEEFNLHDAKVNYLKSLALFESLSEKNKETFQPLLAAVLNNLGVTLKSMDEHQKALEYYELALQNYEYLSANNNALFLPYVAATFNSMAILYAELKKLEKAIEYTHKTIAIYNDLVNVSPEEYTHYLATSLHNLGLFYFELKEIEYAEQYFKESLTMRKDLAGNEPDSFDADFCATALNLVELYQTELENKLDISVKTKCIELLTDVDNRLQKYDDNRSVLKSMKSDCQYYLDYFNTITIEQLQLDGAFKKVDELTQEINSTIKADEKIIDQQKIVETLEKLIDYYPQNKKLKNELAYAYNDLSWLNLRLKHYKVAENVILKAQKLEQTILPLKCNLAHSYLLQDKFAKAKGVYLEFINEKNTDNEPFGITVLRDFDTLKTDGIVHKDFDRIKSLL